MVVISLVGRKVRLERSLVTVGKTVTPCSKKSLPSSLLTIICLPDIVLFCIGQVHDFSGSIKFMLNRFSSLNLASLSSSQDQRMDRVGENTGLADLKANLRRLYEMVAIGIMDNRETTKEVKNLVDVVVYTSYQISNHDARIDDNEMDLKEIMGKVDHNHEDLQCLVQMN